MNDENLELYLYNQFNEILDKNDSESEKQKRLGQLFISPCTYHTLFLMF